MNDRVAPASHVGGSDTRIRDNWLYCFRPNASARMRLFCFPCAGGSANEFRGWVNGLAAAIDLIGVEPPGRFERLREPPYTDASLLVRDLILVCDNLLDRPFALFGHSMGALLALEFAYQLSDIGLPMPLHLLVSARPAPHAAGNRMTHKFDDEALWAVVDRHASIPSVVRRDPGFQRLFLPLFRADMQLVETYSAKGRPALSVPITAIGGSEDDYPAPAELFEWAPYTSATFSQRIFSGGHFYLRERASDLVAFIDSTLAGGHDGLPP